MMTQQPPILSILKLTQTMSSEEEIPSNSVQTTTDSNIGQESTTESASIEIIVGVLVAVLLLTILGVLFVIMFIKKRNQNKKDDSEELADLKPVR